MNKRMGFFALAIAFLGVTAAAIFGPASLGGGWGGVVTIFRASPLWMAQVTGDILISLGLVLAWMVGDARRRGIAVWPYVLLLLSTGSAGPLVYLAMRAADERAPAILSPA